MLNSAGCRPATVTQLEFDVSFLPVQELWVLVQPWAAVTLIGKLEPTYNPLHLGLLPKPALQDCWTLTSGPPSSQLLLGNAADLQVTYPNGTAMDINTTKGDRCALSRDAPAIWCACRLQCVALTPDSV